MANNIDIKDGAGATKTIKTTDAASVHTPHNIVDSIPSIPAGSNNIGDVDILSIAAGDNNIGNVDLASAIPAGENHIGAVGGHTVVVSGNFTRPNDTNIYAAGDTISDSTSAPTSFYVDNCSRLNAGSGTLVSATIADSAAQSTKADLELWIFKDTFTNNNDNVAWQPSDANIQGGNLIAVIALGLEPYAGLNNCFYQWAATPGRGGIPFVCAAASKKIYYALVVRNAYTPVAQERFDITFGIIQD